jgi:hypothetical protein
LAGVFANNKDQNPEGLGLLPNLQRVKKIRDDKGYRNYIDYVR